jgi:hypothetical protein
MNTAERLQSYYHFNEAVIADVSEAMERQANYSYPDFLDFVGADSPKPYELDGYSTRQILDIRPSEHDDKQALIVHLPMAVPLDTNQRYQLASLANVMPNTRIIAMSNPSSGVYKSGGLTYKQRQQVSCGIFKPVTDPLGAYIEKEGIEEVENVGGSYGAELAASFAVSGNHKVATTVYIEPASVIRRGVVKLGLDFKSSEAPMAEYVAANELPAFVEARKDAVGAKDYMSGLLRPTNIAVARGLAKGDFYHNARMALLAQSNMYTSFAWGTDSELALDSEMPGIVSGYTALAGISNVMRIRMFGQKHALGNDLALSIAIVLQSLRR